MKLKNIIRIGAIASLLTCVACEDFFSPSPGDMLLEEDNYSTLNEVYSNFLGSVTTLQKASEQYIVMSELMGDLTQPTMNAPTEIWEIWRHEATNGNDMVDPTPFYNIVVQSNDFLKHVVKFNEEQPNVIPSEIYRGMISSIMANRAWAYLNIGKFYGEAVYYDWRLTDNKELTEEEILSLDELVDELIFFMNNGVDGVDGFNEMNWVWVLGGSDYSWNRMSINSNAIMTELLMWDGNYVEALDHGLNMLVGNGVIKDFGEDIYRLSDLYSENEWGDIFGRFGTANNEILSAVPFDFNKGQTNNLQNLFFDDYYMMPTDSIISYYENTMVDDGDVDGDIYRGEGISYMENYRTGETVISRYLVSSFRHDPTIFIYRASEMYLMMCEALSAIDDFAAADSLLNVGLESSWDGEQLLVPFNTPAFTAKDNLLKNCLGIRGRAGVDPNYLRDHIEEGASNQRKRVVMDSLIAHEVALEHAFEGKRWFTLLRMAKNTNNPSVLANPISTKMPDGESEALKAKLMNPANWYIKYDHLQVKHD